MDGLRKEMGIHCVPKVEEKRAKQRVEKMEKLGQMYHP